MGKKLEEMLHLFEGARVQYANEPREKREEELGREIQSYLLGRISIATLFTFGLMILGDESEEIIRQRVSFEKRRKEFLKVAANPKLDVKTVNRVREALVPGYRKAA